MAENERGVNAASGANVHESKLTPTEHASQAQPVTAPASDPFAAAKGNLRDTIKWLTTAFAALAAAVLAGTSLGGISDLGGWQLVTALAGAALGLTCILLAIGTSLRLLTSESFYLGQLEHDIDLKHRLDQYSADILPPEFETLDEFLSYRRTAIAKLRALKHNQEGLEFRQWSRSFASIDPAVWRLVNLAHFEVLRRAVKRRELPLLVLAIGVLIGLAVFAVFTGSGKEAKRANERPGIPLEFVPGKARSDVGRASVGVSSEAVPLPAQLIGEPSQSG
jgi:hypothetical protein